MRNKNMNFEATDLSAGQTGSSNQYTEIMEDEPPTNTMEELLFRELAVLKLGLDRDAKLPYLLRYTEEAGRGMVASRMIPRGEVIMQETPAVWGPKAPETGVCCLNCGLNLHSFHELTICDQCGLHFCSTKCSLAPQHQAECREMKKLFIKQTINDKHSTITENKDALNKKKMTLSEEANEKVKMDLAEKLTLVIVVLRCLILPETAPQNWARIRLLQDHLEQRKDTKLQMLNQVFLVNFLREVGLCCERINDHEIHRVCGILDSNTFETKSQAGLESRALFPLTAMANSSCLPNVTHVIREDQRMVMVATRDIEKGENICVCYTGIRWGRASRRRHLLLTKYFLCSCSRCLDPTECGTYVSSIRCPECVDGKMVQISEGQEDDWQCSGCCHLLTNNKVLAVEAMCGQLLRMVNHSKPECLEAAARKMRRWLTPHHYIMQEIEMTLINLYEARDAKPERVVSMAHSILLVLTKLEGDSRAVALLKLSLVRAQIKLVRSEEKIDISSTWLEESRALYQHIYPLLRLDSEAPFDLDMIGMELELMLEENLMVSGIGVNEEKGDVGEEGNLFIPLKVNRVDRVIQ